MMGFLAPVDGRAFLSPLSFVLKCKSVQILVVALPGVGAALLIGRNADVLVKNSIT